MSEVTVERGRQIADGTFFEFAKEFNPQDAVRMFRNAFPDGADGSGPFDEEPLRIDDIAGRLLFYDYANSITSDEHMVVRVYANTAFGAPVDSVWKESVNESYVTKFRELYDRLFAIYGDRVNPNPVCYCYPKLGVLIHGQEEEQSVVYDLYDESQYAIPGPEAAFEASDSKSAVYSPYQLLPEGDPLSQERLFLKKEAKYLARKQAILDDRSFFLGTAEGAASEKTLDVPLYGQETPIYCAAATAKMILEFFGFKYSQKDIALLMNIGTSGATNPNQVRAYEMCSKNHLKASYHELNSKVYDDIRSQIDIGCPVKSGIPGHARAVIGWKETSIDKFLYINDPWPVGQGMQRFENSQRAAWLNWICLTKA